MLPKHPELLAAFCTEFQAKLVDKYPDAASIEVLPSNRPGITVRGNGNATAESVGEFAQEVWEYGDWSAKLRDQAYE